MQSTKWRKNVQSHLHALRVSGFCVMIRKRSSGGLYGKCKDN